MLKIKENHKTLIYGLLGLLLIGFSFAYGTQKNMHNTLPEALSRHINSMGVAISELEYGSSGYRGYQKVDDILEIEKIDSKDGSKAFFVSDKTFAKALNIDDAASGGEYCLLTDDKGLVTYYKLAFKIFGYRLSSFFYLYFSLLTLSVVIFFVTFYRRFDLLNVLILFLCGHFVVMAAAPVVGLDLQTVHNARFIPVLAILPAIYIALLILGKHRINKTIMFYTLLQAGLLILAVHVRSSAAYQIMFLCFVFAATALRQWLAKPRLGRYVFSKVRFLPLLIVLIGLFALKAHLAVKLNYPYTSATSSHMFWHAAYLGLGAHPESKSKYGIDYADDAAGYYAASDYLEKQHGLRVPFNFGEQIYEEALKGRYFEILRDDPWFVVMNYLHKIPRFFKNYFSSSFGAAGYLLKWPILLMIAISSFLSADLFFRSWRQYFYIFISGFIFSLLPSFLAMPKNYLIADPALLFTVNIYFIISGVICYVIKREVSV